MQRASHQAAGGTARQCSVRRQVQCEFTGYLRHSKVENTCSKSSAPAGLWLDTAPSDRCRSAHHGGVQQRNVVRQAGRLHKLRQMTANASRRCASAPGRPQATAVVNSPRVGDVCEQRGSQAAPGKRLEAEDVRTFRCVSHGGARDDGDWVGRKLHDTSSPKIATHLRAEESLACACRLCASDRAA